MPPATITTAPSTSRRPIASVGPEDERRDPDAPQRLGRDERRDDRDAAAEVRLEQAEVGEAEEQPRRREAAELAPRRAARRAEARPTTHPGEHRRRRDRLRAAVGVQRADDVVPHGEEHGRAEREEDPARPQMVRPVALGDEQRPAGDDRERADDDAAPRTGSSRNVKAIASAKSGAVPTVTDVREAPTSSIERVKRICDSPGASRPARKNFQAFA